VITITIPHPTDPSYDERHGVAAWQETLTAAPRVWEAAGADLRQFEGRRSGACAENVRAAIGHILERPDDFIGKASYYDLRATVASLTGLFFTLRERPEGRVHVE
jgi:hypothetical protein